MGIDYKRYSEIIELEVSNMAKVNFQWVSLWEAVKEPLRLAVLGIISWLITVIIPQLGDPWIIPLTIGLRFLDKYLYEYGKNTKNTVLAGGITRF